MVKAASIMKSILMKISQLTTAVESAFVKIGFNKSIAWGFFPACVTGGCIETIVYQPAFRKENVTGSCAGNCTGKENPCHGRIRGVLEKKFTLGKTVAVRYKVVWCGVSDVKDFLRSENIFARSTYRLSSGVLNLSPQFLVPYCSPVAYADKNNTL